MDRLLPLVQGKKYDVTAVVSHRLPLSSGPEAYRLFNNRAPGFNKVIMRPWQLEAEA
jgi:threonine dehydrogenase-like Zn-dependent dehydrogenase